MRLGACAVLLCLIPSMAVAQVATYIDRAPGSPVRLISCDAVPNADGSVWLSYVFQNVSRKAISVVRVQFSAYNTFEGRLPGHVSGDSGGSPLLPHESASWQRTATTSSIGTLTPWQDATSVHCEVTNVRFADGSSW